MQVRNKLDLIRRAQLPLVRSTAKLIRLQTAAGRSWVLENHTDLPAVVPAGHVNELRPGEAKAYAAMEVTLPVPVMEVSEVASRKANDAKDDKEQDDFLASRPIWSNRRSLELRALEVSPNIEEHKAKAQTEILETPTGKSEKTKKKKKKLAAKTGRKLFHDRSAPESPGSGPGC